MASKRNPDKGGERKGWVGGRVQSHADLDIADQAFWDQAGPAARFEASIELSLTAWSLRHPHEPAPRFGRDAFGVRRPRRTLSGNRRSRRVAARTPPDHEGLGPLA